jgi:type I restriction enzyme S subunit
MNKLLIQKNFRGSGIQHPDMSQILKIQIPIPPIQTQNKIVKILDQFESLTNSIQEGLPKEIELRHKQYEYYRNQLLTFNSNNNTN